MRAQNHRTGPILITLLAAALFMVLPGQTATAKRGGNAAPHYRIGKRDGPGNPENMERWRKLPPERKEKIIKRYRRWEKLPPEKRERILKRYRKFKNMPPEKRERMKRRWKRMQELSPEERDNLQGTMSKFRRFSPEKKGAIRNNMKGLQNIPVEKRYERFMEMDQLRDFTPGERDVLYKYFFEIRRD
ncbi:MAG: DUF3106 domain-containing protein [Deltaproteobacteria bacterium]|nr:DUF3106 domain-containing protein [Deltaproteobacteria bacterium]NIS77920.1 DUF3106 domain-containing protein [Deltaproteobacteria bacterium]